MKNISRGELKKASVSQLKELCEQCRKEIFDTVSRVGGHLSSNLGTVELTVALHRVFDFPNDKLVFDVGHQCYTHKLLTGRADRFSTLRQKGGISGFPKREESEFDCYDTGHAGTAVSAALGIAKARDIKGESFRVIALVGDGSFNNGLIFEAFNSVKILNSPVLILLNDNGMSISPTVGGTHDVLNAAADGAEDPVRLFGQFGLDYMGSVNGNDLNELLPALEEAKRRLTNNCVLLHVHTKKGQGYPFCENAPAETHGVCPNCGTQSEYCTALGEELTALAAQDKRIVAVTAAMTDSLGLRPFFDAYPERAFDVGICEEHASVLCASMATEGLKPYYAIYSTFLQRAFDEIIHDICGQNLPVTFCIDRAGITGKDGETHQGVFDLSYLSFIPNLIVAIPKDIGEFRAMLRMSVNCTAPLAIRYPREGSESACNSVEIGKFEVLHSTSSNIALLAAGERCLKLAKKVLSAAKQETIEATLINARFLKPLDTQLLSELNADYIITLEDNAVTGGLGDAINRFYLNRGKTICNFGLKEAFIPHGEVGELAEEYGLNTNGILDCLRKFHARG